MVIDPRRSALTSASSSRCSIITGVQPLVAAASRSRSVESSSSTSVERRGQEVVDERATAVRVGRREGEPAVEPARPQQGGVEGVGAVGRGDEAPAVNSPGLARNTMFWPVWRIDVTVR